MGRAGWRLLAAVFVGSMALSPAVATVSEAAAPADDPLLPPVVVSMNLSTSRTSVDWRTTRPQTFAARLAAPPTLTAGIALSWGDKESYDLLVGASREQPLHLGTLTNLSSDVPGTEQHDLWAGLESYAFEQSLGRVEVLDLAADASGTLTRFDIAFELMDVSPGENVFGELRMNEPAVVPSLSPTAEHLHWPQVRVGGSAVLATDAFRNTTDQPVRVGSPRLRGDAARDFSLADDSCRGRVLAPGEECAVTLAYRPRVHGPRAASFVLPSDRGTVVVDLTGSTPLGVSSFTTTGTVVAFPRHQRISEPVVAFGSGRFHPSDPEHTYHWTDDPVGGPNARQRLELILTSQQGPLRTGRHRFDSDHPTNEGLSFSTSDVFCHAYTGTETVRAFALDAEDQPTLARIDVVEACRPDSGDAPHTIRARLRYQDRKDTTAPARPGRVVVDGRTVRWTDARSRDLRTTIVRLSTGGRVTPTTGYPVSAGRARSARLPELRAGEQYTVAAFSVDTAGNVSRARTATFVA